MLNLHNHTGLILTAESVEKLQGALQWLRDEQGAVSCTIEVRGRPGNSAGLILTEATLTAAGVVTL